jgi:hypothetical protein
MKSQALAGSALVALGVATGSLLAPQAASALDFTFSFGGVGGVEGLISGLVDNTNSQVCDSPSSCVVSVSNPGLSGAAPGVYTYSPVQSGFDVQDGQIIVAWWGGLIIDPIDPGSQSYLVFQQAGTDSVGILGTICGLCSISRPVQGPITFSADVPSIPGPLPLFGAAAAFGFSRKLRNRIKVTRTTALTRPAG